MESRISSFEFSTGIFVCYSKTFTYPPCADKVIEVRREVPLEKIAEFCEFASMCFLSLAKNGKTKTPLFEGYDQLLNACFDRICDLGVFDDILASNEKLKLAFERRSMALALDRAV